jgi:hypothetical protein
MYNSTTDTNMVLANKKSINAKKVLSVFPTLPTLARTLEIPLWRVSWSGRSTWYSYDWPSEFFLESSPERYMDKMPDIPTMNHCSDDAVMKFL